MWVSDCAILSDLLLKLVPSDAMLFSSSDSSDTDKLLKSSGNSFCLRWDEETLDHGGSHVVVDESCVCHHESHADVSHDRYCSRIESSTYVLNTMYYNDLTTISSNHDDAIEVVPECDEIHLSRFHCIQYFVETSNFAILGVRIVNGHEVLCKGVGMSR